MKKLLTTLATLSLLTPIVSTLVNNQFKTTNNTQSSGTKKYYWNSNHRSMEFVSRYDDATFSLFSAVIDMGDTKITNYQYFNIIDENNVAFTRTSWGDRKYFGVNFNKFQNASIGKYIQDKWVNINRREVEESASIVMLLNDDSSGWASMRSEQRIGLNYYWRGSNYLQVFGLQSTETWNSSSGGSMWLNIGQGIEIW
ncbi:MAG: hypothetical protein REH79_02735 [Spiroplasma sp.]|nr:hypothetical protein [Spiroplasma sp.]